MIPCHSAEDHDMNLHHCKNLKSCSLLFLCILLIYNSVWVHHHGEPNPISIYHFLNCCNVSHMGPDHDFCKFWTSPTKDL